MQSELTVDSLAQEIRRVDGSNSLGAGALAEALMPFLTAALSDKQAVEVKIKPLEWKLTHEGIEHASFMGVVYYARGDGRWGHTLEVRQNQSGSSMEAARAAAQADYEQRIRSALVDVPAEPVAWLPADDAPRGVYALIKHRSGQLDLCYKTDNGEPFLETWRYAGTAKRGEQAPWPESYIPVSDLRTSPPLSREGEDSAEVER